MLSWVSPETRKKKAYGNLGNADGELILAEDVRKVLQGMFINLCMKVAEIIQNGNKDLSVVDL